MNKKDVYLSLIDDSVSEYNKKYEKKLRYDLLKFEKTYQFTIYDGITPILFKSIQYDKKKKISSVYSEILMDFIIGTIERVYMQFHNQKKIVPKKHAEINNDKIALTKGKW